MLLTTLFVLSSVVQTPATVTPQVNGSVRVRSAHTQMAKNSSSDTLMQTRLGLTWGKESPFGGHFVFQDSRSLSDMVVSKPGTVLLHTGYLSAHWKNGITAQFGRRELSLGKQRLLTALPWSNVGKAFDGLFVSGDAKTLPFGFLAWAAQPYQPTPDSQGGLTSQSGAARFEGLYVTLPVNKTMSVETWAMRNKVLLGGTVTERTSRITTGAAYRLRLEAITADLEASMQSGDMGDKNISAYGAAVNAQWTGKNIAGKPRVGFEVNVASGDTDGTDDTSNTYDPLHPLGHAYWGHMDLVGGRNALDLRAWLGGNLGKTALTLDTHVMSVMSLKDKFYKANGQARATDLSGLDAKDIGIEVDFYAKRKYAGMTALVGMSVFLPGTVGKAAGYSDARTWGYVQLISYFK